MCLSLVACAGVLAVNKTKMPALIELTFYWMGNKEQNK